MTSSNRDEDGFTPRRPDFELVITSKKNTKQKCYAGVAYANSSTGYTLKLKPGISINWDDEVYLTLWPVGSPREEIDVEPPGGPEPKWSRTKKAKTSAPRKGKKSDDIPFK